MGCCISQEERDAHLAHENIESQLKRDRVTLRNEVKMLLLGKSPFLPSPPPPPPLFFNRLMTAHECSTITSMTDPLYHLSSLAAAHFE